MIKQLYEVADVISGYPFRGSIPEESDGEAYVLQMKDANNDATVNWDGLLKTNLTGRRKPDWLKSEDILFLSRGNNNIAVYLDHVPIPAVSSPHFFLIRVNKDIGLIPEFLAWQINQTPAQQYFNMSAEGSLQRSIKRSVLDLFKVVIPDLKTQETVINLNRIIIKERNIYINLIKNRAQMMNAVASDILTKITTHNGGKIDR